MKSKTLVIMAHIFFTLAVLSAAITLLYAIAARMFPDEMLAMFEFDLAKLALLQDGLIAVLAVSSVISAIFVFFATACPHCSAFYAVKLPSLRAPDAGLCRKCGNVIEYKK